MTQKVRRSYNSLRKQLETTKQAKQAVERQLAESQTEATRILEFNKAATVSVRRMNRNLQGQLETTRQAKQAVERQLAASKANIGNFLSKLDGEIRVESNKKRLVVPVLRDRPGSYYTRALFLEAVNNGFDQIVEVLLQNSPELINSRSGNGLNGNNSALHQAARKGHDAVLRVLLANNADVNERSGRSLILDVIGLCVNPLYYSCSSSSRTALHGAAQEGHDAAVRVLLDKGADMNAKDSSGQTALHVATRFGRKTIVQTLLNKEGIEVNAEDNRGKTALQYVLGIYSEKRCPGNIKRVIELLRNTGAR